MSRFFYGKLAFSNLKKNGGLYLPYILSAMGISAMYYIIGAISRDPGIAKMPGSDNLALILGLGCGVIMIFAVIFLFYTNSFLMKRRKKEFGLFHILGMEKRHIGRMMFWEILMVGGLSMAGGALLGIVLNKLMVLILLRLVDLEVPFGFTVSIEAIVNMAVLFSCIFAATLVYNLFQVQKAKPIELLQSVSQGEKEPKTRWLLAVAGLFALAGGYAIAIFVEDPMSVLLLFFLAVILVMAGTYSLFTAGSVAILKLLRKNKNYYYKISHFTSVSGLIYRMKQNAVGLSNICILSTMVLVMLSGTLSLFMGVDSTMRGRYPMELNMTGRDMDESQNKAMESVARQASEELGLEIEKMVHYSNLSFHLYKDGEKLNMQKPDSVRTPKGELCVTEWITLEDYECLGGEHIELAEDEALLYTVHGNHNDQNIQLLDKTFHIKKHLSKITLGDMQGQIMYDVYFLVVRDQQVLQEIYELQKSVYGKRASSILSQVFLDVSGGSEQESALGKRIRELLAVYADEEEGMGEVQVDIRAEQKESFMIFCGGFLFLGIFLGFIFLMATTLIIYYKQISEGYEDKVRFEIMQKVGMSKKEVRGSIRSQILKVFFFPLIMACIHLAAAFPMIVRLLQLFGMMDVSVFAACTLGTVGVFTLIYAVVYGITAKSYYKIVG